MTDDSTSERLQEESQDWKSNCQLSSSQCGTSSGQHYEKGKHYHYEKGKRYEKRGKHYEKGNVRI
jgi:hypothetical protein